MAAGHDTSANVLSWGVYIMATRKDIQSKLRKEIEALVAEVPAPTYTEIDKLPYLDHFIKETLRVLSPGLFRYSFLAMSALANRVSSYDAPSPSNGEYDYPGDYDTQGDDLRYRPSRAAAEPKDLGSGCGRNRPHPVGAASGRTAVAVCLRGFLQRPADLRGAPVRVLRDQDYIRRDSPQIPVPQRREAVQS